eukprot:COSAG01_NODE_143_length_24153_cov_54.226116_7_plen_146_part_00
MDGFDGCYCSRRIKRTKLLVDGFHGGYDAYALDDLLELHSCKEGGWLGGTQFLCLTTFRLYLAQALIPLVPFARKSGAMATVSARKLFHVIALALFYPGLAIRVEVMSIAFAVNKHSLPHLSTFIDNAMCRELSVFFFGLKYSVF